MGSVPMIPRQHKKLHDKALAQKYDREFLTKNKNPLYPEKYFESVNSFLQPEKKRERSPSLNSISSSGKDNKDLPKKDEDTGELIRRTLIGNH